MFSNGRDTTKFQFLQDDDNDAKAIAMPPVFSEK